MTGSLTKVLPLPLSSLIAFSWPPPPPSSSRHVRLIRYSILALVSHLPPAIRRSLKSAFCSSLAKQRRLYPRKRPTSVKMTRRSSPPHHRVTAADRAQVQSRMPILDHLFLRIVGCRAEKIFATTMAEIAARTTQDARQRLP